MSKRLRNQRESIFNWFSRRSGCFTPVYDDATPAVPPVVPPSVPPVVPKAGEPTTFTQEQVNAMIAKERAADKEKQAKLVEQLETVKSTSTLTKQERDKLEAQIEELKTSNMTKEELAARERKKLETQLSKERDDAKKDADSWRNRFESSLVARNLMDAAVSAEAFNPAQLVAMLTPSTKVLETKDAEGNLTGMFDTQVTFEDTDKDGKPIKLVLTPAELVKRMKDIPERFGNLFKSGAVPGLGGTHGKKLDGTVNYETMTPAQYRVLRKQLKSEGKL